MKTLRLPLLAFALSSLVSTAPAFAQADNTNSKTAPAFSGWMDDHARTNQGRITRDAYMREQERRWDAADTQRRGLTIDEINHAYGYGGTPTPMGTTVNPSNMGPGNVKGQ